MVVFWDNTLDFSSCVGTNVCSNSAVAASFCPTLLVDQLSKLVPLNLPHYFAGLRESISDPAAAVESDL